MRPKLSKKLHVDRYKDFYWLKEELQVFCREHGISATGSKLEISNRIETFLRTGEILKPDRKSRRKAEGVLSSQLSLETVITENHRCSQTVRAFFKTIIPNFHFSTHIQNYFKTNVGNTYRDAVEAWYEEEERKKDPSYKKEIAPQFEYNRFIRDYYADPKNQGKSREKAIEAWNEIKKRPGSNQYNPS
ncbi:cytoplasmic protein [Ornithinibacillus sp. BX22]|uniref:Cytoplasmic protein n=1 Tax=Ornithinibacillus hominis TaxID=2763055 RepID=A0A923RJN2_9BACI|nr:DUF6434 domain-containing protein [Ornithinibacillus hominis]MBC5638106.1 cytoplasmic protein [Ornithinibacillus hominis]